MKDSVSYVGPAGYGDNIKFIANYLFKNPGCGSTEVRRALCLTRGKKYTRGQYTSYFSINSVTLQVWVCVECNTTSNRN